jgi:hypothetical protein
VTTKTSRRRAILAAAAWGLRDQPAGVVAARLGVSERSVERYWRLGMGEGIAAGEACAPELSAAQLEVIAHNIAGWAPDVAAARELAECLEIPVSAFEDARAAIRQQQFAAPAAELFTVLHKVSRIMTGGVRQTVCGRAMLAGGLWQFIEAADGDPVCPSCTARSNGHARQESLL